MTESAAERVVERMQEDGIPSGDRRSLRGR